MRFARMPVDFRQCGTCLSNTCLGSRNHAGDSQKVSGKNFGNEILRRSVGRLRPGCGERQLSYAATGRYKIGNGCDNCLHACFLRHNCIHTGVDQSRIVLLRDDAASNDKNVFCALFFQAASS